MYSWRGAIERWLDGENAVQESLHEATATPPSSSEPVMILGLDGAADSSKKRKADSMSINTYGMSVSVQSTPKTVHNQMMTLEAVDNGLQHAILDIHHAPEGALELIRRVNMISHLHYFIRKTYEATIPETEKATGEWVNAVILDDLKDDLPPELPTFDSVEEIYTEAIESMLNRSNETECLLNIVFMMRKMLERQQAGDKGSSFQVVPCNDAAVAAEYLSAPWRVKKIDACITAKREGDKPFRAALDQLKKSSPIASVNVSNNYRIKNDPVVIAIEVKTSRAPTPEAELQLATWCVAQWRFLTKHVTAHIQEDNKEKSLAGSEVDDKIKRAMSELPFLPAIRVEGLQWFLVLTTYDGAKLKIWQKQAIGSQKTPAEVLALMSSLHRILSWVQDEYLPWFRKWVLNLNEKDGAGEMNLDEKDGAGEMNLDEKGGAED